MLRAFWACGFGSCRPGLLVSGRPGRRGGRDRCPLAAAETDRIEEHSAHAAADLPTHLGAHGTDAGNIQRDIAADPDRVGAFRHEAALRDIADADLDAVPIAVADAGSGLHLGSLGVALALTARQFPISLHLHAPAP